MLDYLERSPEFAQFLWGRSRERWREAAPDAKLTWGQKPSGTQFMRMAAKYAPFTDRTRVLEVGPGYGRLGQASLDLGMKYASWLGVDISEQNVRFLSNQYPAPRHAWVEADIETVQLEGSFDVCVSSLTFKHLFPTFEKAAKSASSYLVNGGHLVIDCIEGRYRWFEDDGATWIREYSRPEISLILQRCGFSGIQFDRVRHTMGYARLLVVAIKQDDCT